MADSTLRDISEQPARLADRHKHSLQHESGIAPDILAERGVHTVERFSEVPTVFSRKQRRKVPGILFTIHRPNGETSCVLRPDEPDPENPGRKYEQPPKRGDGPGNFLDVHPRMRHLLENEDVPLVFVEGIKKADALTSRGILAVGITGTWNWMSGGEPIPDMWEIPVEGRRVDICYDSDMLRNPNVQMAAERLGEHLANRGAEVWIVYLPDQPDGSKTGADDFLAAGGTAEELLALARPFDPEDIQRVKLSRSERLRRSIEHLWGLLEGMPAKTPRDCSRLAAWRTCCKMAERRGKLVGDGIDITLSSRSGAEMAHMSQPTFSACLKDFEEAGLVRRVKDERLGHADSYVLRVPGGVSLFHNGEKGRKREGEGAETGGVNPRDKATPPLPEVRWSSPGARKRRRGVVSGTRRVRQSVPSGESQAKMRPGKKRDEIVRYVLGNGGTATREELLGRFGGARTTWRDFKKQTLSVLLGRQRRYGDTPLSVGPPVIELTREGVRLVEDWEIAWAKHRILSEEEEAARKQQRDHLAQSMGFRLHLAEREAMEERRKHLKRDRDAMLGNALVRLFAEAPANRDLFPDEMAKAAVRLLPGGFPHDAEPFGNPRPEEVVAFLEAHELPVPTPIYDRHDRLAERRFREMERAVQEDSAPDSGNRESVPALGPDGVFRHGPECECWMCGDIERCCGTGKEG